MNLVNLELAVKVYGEHPLLDQVSLGVSAGDRIGVVGRNGAGKSTLLTALAGAGDLDAGRSTRARDITVGYLPQAQQAGGQVREVVFGSRPEHEWAAEPRSRSVIGALLAGIDPDAQIGQLSGGERRRTMLASVLLDDRDLLLLDEPTNHLDIEAIRWLAGYLKEFGRSYVVVTHDRWFLDEVCERTWEVAGGQVHAYDGGYSAFVLARAERARLAEAADLRRRNLLRKELAWLRRGPPARTSKPKFRIEAANALIDGEPPARDGVELTSLAASRLGKTVLELTGVSVTAGGRRLLEDVTWQLGPGDRVGIVGVNGSGKTTLLQLLAGLLDTGGDATAAAPAGLHATGRVRRGSTVRLGYLTQEPPRVDPALRVLEAAERVRGSVRIGKRELSASQLLERLGLRGDRQWAPVGELSGGERRRLQLMLLLLGEPNVLLLDEPTNDLDIETLTELEDLLDGWPGSVLAVSHDRYFLERVTDHVLALIGGQLAFLPGGIDEYLARRDREQAQPAAPAAARPGGAALAGPGDGPAAIANPAAGPVPAARQRAGQKELARLERQIGRLTDAETSLNEELARSAADYERLIELGVQLRAAQEERAALEERWLMVAEEIS
ncbi:MAG TPA: ABC-F family ATP-binding cassette domain-containing protein [Streptosporangiaceae bacterium]|nr:ABC-F family ATP-binding cassette domain-containing protein [Streptosporangiaceae bacterium]